MKSNLSPAWLIAAGCLLFTGCNYEVPLTAKPTHQIDARLLGDWVAMDPDAKKEEIMSVRKFDDTTYAVALDNDIYRVFHPHFAGAPFVTPHHLTPNQRKYSHYP